MRIHLVALTALMLFATPVAADDLDNAIAAFDTGDYQKAFRLLKPFAEQGHAKAQTMVDLMYSQGACAPTEFVKAIHWLRKGVEQGHAEAQCRMRGFFRTSATSR